MNGINSLNSIQVGGDHESGGGGGGLSQLEDRVSRAIRDNSGNSPIDSQVVRNLINKISQTPLPGMSQNFVV